MHLSGLRCAACLTAVTIFAALPAAAQQSMHAGMHDSSPNPMMQSMQGMQKELSAAPMTGDADHDFAAMMSPHHQGAIDMARAELDHGKDPVLRRMAQDIIAAQEKEIGDLKDWLAKHPAP